MADFLKTTDDVHELFVERHIAAPPEIIWQVMTEQLAEWWCPRPWTTTIIEQDWRPGGRNAVVMRGPEGEGGESPIEGIFLEVTPNKGFVFTNAFKVGWIPQPPFMVGYFELTPDGKGGTHYRAGSRHWDEAAMKQHDEMGFSDGWGKVADQLAEIAEAKAKRA